MQAKTSGDGAQERHPRRRASERGTAIIMELMKMRETRKIGLSPESQGQNLAVIVLHVPSFWP